MLSHLVGQSNRADIRRPRQHEIGLADHDLVVFPVDCVSHEATILVKRFRQDTATPFRPVRSASLASFIQAIAPSPDTVGD